MLVQMTVSDFLAEIKSDSAAPGGGSVAALSGALGAALAAMVANLTLDNAKYEAVHAEVARLRPQMHELMSKLEHYVDEDTAMFNKVMDAYRLPKATDEEKTARSAAIQLALKGAAELPMQVALCCQEALLLSKKMLEIGNTNAASDAAVAGRMANTGMWGAIYNVRINLGSIKDQAFTEDMKSQIAALIVHAEIAMQELLNEVEKKIG